MTRARNPSRESRTSPRTREYGALARRVGAPLFGRGSEA